MVELEKKDWESVFKNVQQEGKQLEISRAINEAVQEVLMKKIKEFEDAKL